MPPTASSFSTSESLIRLVQAADEHAWVRLSQLYGPLVYKWARKLGARPEDSADIVQNVFLLVTQKVNGYSSQRPDATFRGWLSVITRHCVYQFYRRQSTQPNAAGGSDAQLAQQQISDPLNDADCSSEICHDVHSRIELAHRALGLIQNDFEPRTLEAFRRTTLEEQTAEEVGKSLGLTAKAVRQAKYRVLLRLRQMLADK